MSSSRSSRGGKRETNVSIPAPPAALAKVIRIAGDPDRSLRDLGRVCSQDPGLTIELLRVANSARYSAPGQRIRNVPQAVVKLGARAVRAHSITYSIRAAVTAVGTGGLDAKLFWEDSLRRAAAAQILAEISGYEDPFEAFALGLTQDLGTLLLAVRLPHLGEAIQGLREKPGSARLESERVLTGRSHTEEFEHARLAEILPEEIAFAVIHHHNPPDDETRVARLTRLGYLADLLADVVQAHPKGLVIERATEMIQKSGIEQPLEALVDHMAKRLVDLAEELDIRVGAQPSLGEVMVEAQNAMLQLAQQQEEQTSALEAQLRAKEEETRVLEESNRRLMHMASKDTLTELDNRRMFNRALQSALEDAVKQFSPASILIVDVDHFKRVNDTYGHPAGDAVLRALARRMEGALRTVDKVARLGGEEFGVLLPNSTPAGGRMVAERIRMAIEASPVPTDEGPVACTVSIGGTTLDPDRVPRTRDELIKQADQALYLAKNTGRNQVCWYGQKS
jgi:diguanylate cyclase (GGDEF)-like protein